MREVRARVDPEGQASGCMPAVQAVRLGAGMIQFIGLCLSLVAVAGWFALARHNAGVRKVQERRLAGLKLTRVSR